MLKKNIKANMKICWMMLQKSALTDIWIPKVAAMRPSYIYN